MMRSCPEEPIDVSRCVNYKSSAATGLSVCVVCNEQYRRLCDIRLPLSCMSLNLVHGSEEP